MRSRAKVIQLVSGLSIGDELGGAELFGVELACYLDPQHFDAMVVGLWRYDSQSERNWLQKLEQLGIPAVLLGDPNKPLHSEFLSVVRSFWCILDSFSPDLINSHAERADVLNLLAHMLHRSHPRAVRTMHTDQQWQQTPWLGFLLNLVVFPRGFSAEVPISIAARDALKRRPLSRMLGQNPAVIYNGIDENLIGSSFSDVDCESIALGDGSGIPRVGVVGRLTKQKGHCFLLEAAAAVLQVRPVSFVVVGSGSEEFRLRSQTRSLGIDKAVHFLGSRNDVYDIMSCLDLLVSPSLWEGLPTVILEAMALGLPVLATDVSGSREIVRTGHTGILVPPGEPTQLANGILDMLSHPDRCQAMAEEAKRMVTYYTIQRAAALYGQSYRALLGE